MQNHIIARKRWKRKVAHELGIPAVRLGWIDGELYVLADHTKVIGVPKIPKPQKVEKEDRPPQYYRGRRRSYK